MRNNQATYQYYHMVIDPIGLNLRNFSTKISQIEKYVHLPFCGVGRDKMSPPFTSFPGLERGQEIPLSANLSLKWR